MCAQENAEKPKLKLKILAIEDDQTIIKLYQHILSNDGHRVISAMSGAEAIKKLKEEAFDLVCLDLKLPDMDGVELLKLIKRKVEWIPVIIVTANPTLESSVAAVNAGIVTEYIAKPFDTKELVLIVRQSVEKARLALENKRLLKRLENTNQALTERVQQLEEFAKDTVKMQDKISELNQYVRALEQKVNSPGKK
jgi:DNA-binding NtrC family response regulator